MKNQMWGPWPFTLQVACSEPVRLVVQGRKRWALQLLMKTGIAGISTFDTFAPRLSAYIHELRALGLDIETVRERHGGAFKGYHARYILRSNVHADRLCDLTEAHFNMLTALMRRVK